MMLLDNVIDVEMPRVNGPCLCHRTQTCKFSAVTGTESGDTTILTVYLRTLHLAKQYRMTFRVMASDFSLPLQRELLLLTPPTLETSQLLGRDKKLAIIEPLQEAWTRSAQLSKRSSMPSHLSFAQVCAQAAGIEVCTISQEHVRVVKTDH